ncbi:Crp/Fnr family transcriptional regulator [Chloroflexota bacterium]
MTSSVDFLRSQPYFNALSDEEMARIERGVVELSFGRGELLFLEGEACRGLYVVKSGQIRIFKSSPEGREQVLLIAKAGDTFNDIPIFDGGPNPASASALEPSTVYLIPRETMLFLLAGCPAALAIIKMMASRLRHLTMMVEDLSFRTVISRLAKTLLEVAVVEGGASPVRRLTQDEIAAMVGTVRDVINRALRVLEREGTIKFEGQRIIVVDPQKLKEMT